MSVVQLKVVLADPWKMHYSDFRLSNKLVDSCGMACSTEYVATIPDGASSVALFKLAALQRKPPLMKLRGHTSTISDMLFSPFYATIIATASEDSTVRIWDVPMEIIGAEMEVQNSVATLNEHSRKIASIDWNPITDFILSSASFDQTLKVWDVDRGTAISSYKHNDKLFSCKWNSTGNLLAASCKDTNLYVTDPRAAGTVATTPCHDANKMIKITWTDGHAGVETYLLTTGFTKNQERQMNFWDMREITKPVISVEFDRSSSYFIPQYDETLGVIYIAAKGEGIARCYQLRGGELYRLEEYRTSVPTRTFCFVPKRALDVNKCEIGRMLRNEENKNIVPISFYVPRKNATSFQEDLYPPPPSIQPALTVEEWLQGQNAVVNREPQIPPEKGQTDSTGTDTCSSSPSTRPRLTRCTGSFKEAPAVLKRQAEHSQQEMECLQKSLGDALANMKIMENNNHDLKQKYEESETKRKTAEQKLKVLEQKLMEYASVKKELFEMENFISEVAEVCRGDVV